MSRLETDRARSLILRKTTGTNDAVQLLECLGLGDITVTATAQDAAAAALPRRSPLTHLSAVKGWRVG